jgi:hypothetical protein
MLGSSYTEEINHFSAEAKVFKDLVYTPKRHTGRLNWLENHSMQFLKAWSRFTW